MGDQVVRRHLCPRAAVAVSRDRTCDDSWVCLLEEVKTEPEPLQRPGPEVVEDNVGASDELEERLAARIGTHVELEHALVTRCCVLEGGGNGQLTGQIDRLTGSHNPDHVGAKVSENSRRDRTGEKAGEVENADVVQGPRLTRSVRSHLVVYNTFPRHVVNDVVPRKRLTDGVPGQRCSSTQSGRVGLIQDSANSTEWFLLSRVRRCVKSSGSPT